MNQYYVVSVKHTKRENRYITVWRPSDCGYAWPLSWAGKYDEATIDAHLSYYHNGSDTFVVPCAVMDEMAVPVIPGTVDGDAGPVVMNNRENWRRLIQAMPFPSFDQPKPEYKGARRHKEK